MRNKEGLVKNKNIAKLAERSFMVINWIDKIKSDGTLLPEQKILRVDELFKKESKNLKGLISAVYDGLEVTAKATHKELFSNLEIDMYQHALQVPVLNQYNEASGAERLAMVDNPHTARIISSLARNGLISPTIIESIDKRHSPEAQATLSQAEADLNVLGNMEKELKSLHNVEWDATQAERIRETQVNFDN